MRQSLPRTRKPLNTKGNLMTKNRLSPPGSTAAVQSKVRGPNFRPKKSGAILKVGSIKAIEPPANPPAREGVKKSLYWNK
jgi:hypothetical protein